MYFESSIFSNLLLRLIRRHYMKFLPEMDETRELLVGNLDNDTLTGTAISNFTFESLSAK